MLSLFKPGGKFTVFTFFYSLMLYFTFIGLSSSFNLVLLKIKLRNDK